MSQNNDVHYELNQRSFDWRMLTPSSVVVEIGAYCGRWSAEICSRYNPRLYAFEPQRWAFDICREMLARHNQAQVFNYALGLRDETLPMGKYFSDGCSFVDASPVIGGEGRGEIREARRVLLDELGLQAIDLMLMNIEGYEYDLIPHLFQAGVMTHVKRFMIQFHPLLDKGGQIDACLNLLRADYDCLFDFGALLSAWERK